MLRLAATQCPHAAVLPAFIVLSRSSSAYILGTGIFTLDYDYFLSPLPGMIALGFWSLSRKGFGVTGCEGV